MDELPDHFNDLPKGILEILYTYWHECLVHNRTLEWHYYWRVISSSNLQPVKANDPMKGRIDQLLPFYERGTITNEEIDALESYLKTQPSGPPE